MNKFLQGDLVTIHTDTIPNTDIPTVKMFPLGIGIVSHTTMEGTSSNMSGKHAHLIPIARVHPGRMTQEDHINWVRKKFESYHGQLIARDIKYRVSKWFFWEKDLKGFNFSGKYFDDDLFKMD